MLATLTISAPDWLLPAAILFGVTLLVMVWSYRAAPPGSARWLCPLLKAMGIAALALCLLEPLWSRERAKPGANLFAILADNSAGLQIADQGEAIQRGQQLKALLEPDPGSWQGALAENFEVRRFMFDSRLNATRDFSGMDFSGRASSLGAALRGIRERFQGRPLAGVLMFTDGIATDIRDGLPDLKGLPPVYPVVVGSRGGIRDVGIGQLNLTQTVFEDAPVSAQVHVEAAGFRGEQITAELMDATGKPVAEQKQRVRGDQGALVFRFQWRPETPGLAFYQLRVGLTDELKRATNAAPTREATLVNNTRVIAVDRGHGPYRILYVSGRPNWEFKFLNRAEQEDDQVQLIGLIRIAKREPKFDFRGRAGETSNPLYRGFGNQNREDLEQYDQPVLIRLNTRDELELQNGFPGKVEELFEYSAVVLDDLEAAFFTADQAALLQRFVSERGGGLLMLGGMESFRQGDYQRTPIGDMLPVYLDRDTGGRPSAGLKWDLSREGWLQPWARLRDNEGDERQRLHNMPPFQVINPAREVKPGASVIASAKDENGKEYPVLATQRFGRGQTAALMVGDVWRWGMQGAEARRDMEKSWRQMLRWLVSDVPKRVEFAIEQPPDEAAGAVKLEVCVRDEKFQPLDDALVSIEIQPVLSDGHDSSTNAIQLRAEPSPTDAGVYETTYVPRHAGGYRASAQVTDAAGAKVGDAEAGWSTDLMAEEFKSLEPNISLLEAIANRTGGRILTAGGLQEFARSLPSQRSPIMETWSTPAWHTPFWFGFALACLISEWGLRRWKGLP